MSASISMNLSDRIVEKCFEKYNKLGKNGKPQPGRQWTLLSGIVMECKNELKVVSLATGTKCIGANSMCSEGMIVNDSHAEVLARRALIRYIYDQFQTIKRGGSSEILTLSESKYSIKKDIKWHMYMSQVPCGDASIIPMEPMEDAKNRDEPVKKRQRLDIFRTGAKPVSSEWRQDKLESGHEYHTKGAVRIKPGRGDPTLSLSCTDKITRWIHLGLQGALISHLIDGHIKLSTIVIGGGSPFDHDVIFDSLIKRGNETADVPQLLQSKLKFVHSPDNVPGGKPSPASVIWSNVTESPVQVSVEGKRLGTTYKSPDKGMLKISKRQFLISFLMLCPDDMKSLTYREIKDRAETYQSLSKSFKLQMGAWSNKPPFENFKINE